MKRYWTELVIGAFILASPWLLGFSDIALARWGNVLCGLILILISIWALFGDVAPTEPSPSISVGSNVNRRKLKNNKSREIS